MASQKNPPVTIYQSARNRAYFVMVCSTTYFVEQQKEECNGHAYRVFDAITVCGDSYAFIKAYEWDMMRGMERVPRSKAFWDGHPGLLAFIHDHEVFMVDGKALGQ